MPEIRYLNQQLTFRQLAEAINDMSDEQKDMIVQIEDPGSDSGSQIQHAELRVADSENVNLPEGHPVIYYPLGD